MTENKQNLEQYLKEAHYSLKRTELILDYAIRIVESYKQIKSRIRKSSESLLTFISNSQK